MTDGQHYRKYLFNGWTQTAAILITIVSMFVVCTRYIDRLETRIAIVEMQYAMINTVGSELSRSNQKEIMKNQAEIIKLASELVSLVQSQNIILLDIREIKNELKAK